MNRKSWIAPAALAVAVALASGAAWASPITTQWSYDYSSQWNTTDTVFSSGQGSTTNSATKLAWGIPEYRNGSQSSLVINPSTSTGILVNTYEGNGTIPSSYISNPGIVLTHNNFPIDGSSKSLKKASLSNTITLSAVVPPGSTLSPYTFSFGINFDETPNQYPCAVNPTNPDNPCPDIFVIDQSSLNQTFTYDGHDYFLSVFPLLSNGSLGFLPNAACHSAGVANGCFGFVTQENSSNPLNFGLSISTAPFVIGVPEPGVLGLFGLGLLGLAGLCVIDRRRHTAG